MVRTNSTMLPLETPLPFFDLKVVPGTSLEDGQEKEGLARIATKDLSDRPVLLMLLCAHCPFVKHLEVGLSNLAEDFGDRVQILAISSNSLITHPQDGPVNLMAQANEHGWKFPYLLDSDQNFAKALKAACTPDFFLFSCSSNGDQKLRYRGQFDGSRPGNNIPVSGEDIRTALDAVLEGKSVPNDQKPSIGCNIKWHPGLEPEWFL